MNQGSHAGMLPGSGVRASAPATGATRTTGTLIDTSVGPLEGGAGVAPATTTHPADVLRLWHPDVAALLSLVLTPVFGAWLHLVNARALRNSRLLKVALMWFVLALAFTASGLYLVSAGHLEPISGFSASALLGGYTVVWYAFAAYKQSRWLAALGRQRWQARSLWQPTLLALALMQAPWLLDSLATRL